MSVVATVRPGCNVDSAQSGRPCDFGAKLERAMNREVLNSAACSAGTVDERTKTMEQAAGVADAVGVSGKLS